MNQSQPTMRSRRFWGNQRRLGLHSPLELLFAPLLKGTRSISICTAPIDEQRIQSYVGRTVRNDSKREGDIAAPQESRSQSICVILYYVTV
jgi:hypothetical protein